jgi:hypothetical protein
MFLYISARFLTGHKAVHSAVNKQITESNRIAVRSFSMLFKFQVKIYGAAKFKTAIFMSDITQDMGYAVARFVESLL